MPNEVEEHESQPLTTPAYWQDVWSRRDQSYGLVVPRFFELKKQRHNRSLAQLLGEMMDACGPGPISVLELGCAPGLMIYKMHQQRPLNQYFGVDYAEDALDATRGFLKHHDVPCKLFAADCRSFDAPQKFDLVVSYGLVEHFKTPLPIVEAHAEHARDGGYVAFTIPNYRPLPVRWLISQLDPEALIAHNLELMDQQVLSELMRSCNLKNVLTGECGPALLRTTRDRRASALRNRVLQRAGQLYNALPMPPLWHSMLWAKGRVERPLSE